MDATLYDQFAALERDHWWFRARRDIVAQVISRYLGDQSSHQILDVGCGTGGMLGMLTRFGNVTGLDMSPEAVDYCRRELGSRVELRVGGIPDDLPAGVQWDLVTAFDVIEHIEDDRDALRGIYQAVRPGGRFVCTVPAFQFLWGPHDNLNHHFRRYVAPQLRSRLTEAGFRIEFLSYYNSWLFPLVAAVRVLKRLRPGTAQEAYSDITMPSRITNRVLTGVFGSEALLLPRISFPVGVSLLAVCRRPEVP